MCCARGKVRGGVQEESSNRDEKVVRNENEFDSENGKNSRSSERGKKAQKKQKKWVYS